MYTPSLERRGRRREGRGQRRKGRGQGTEGKGRGREVRGWRDGGFLEGFYILRTSRNFHASLSEFYSPIPHYAGVAEGHRLNPDGHSFEDWSESHQLNRDLGPLHLGGTILSVCVAHPIRACFVNLGY